MAWFPGTGVEREVEAVFGAIYLRPFLVEENRKGRETNRSLWTHVEGLSGVVGPIFDSERWLWGSESILSDRGSSEGDFLEISYIVLLGVGALEGAVI